MLRRVRRGPHPVGPACAHEGPRGVEAVVEVERADQRLHHVAQHIVAVGGAVVAGLPAQPQVRGHADLAGDRRADRTGDERVQPLRQLSLRLVRKCRIKPFRDGQTQDTVAEKFEPLVILRRLAAMGQRPAVTVEVAGRMAQRVRQPGVEVGQKPSPIRFQRAAVNQVQGMIHDAPPSVDQKPTAALPSRFSSGT